MEITIHHRNVEMSDTLRATVTEKISKLSRFLEGMDHAEVRFHEERNPRISEKEVCEVTVHGHGHVVRAKAAAGDIFAAVDRVVDKLVHQLEKLKGKLVGRSQPRRPAPVDFAADSGIPELSNDADEADDDGGARIVKTKAFAIKPMTPEEAALQLDLLGHGFYFFTNAETDRAAVVYRRHDGHIGLIDASS